MKINEFLSKQLPDGPGCSEDDKEVMHFAEAGDFFAMFHADVDTFFDKETMQNGVWRGYRKDTDDPDAPAVYTLEAEFRWDNPGDAASDSRDDSPGTGWYCKDLSGWDDDDLIDRLREGEVINAKDRFIQRRRERIEKRFQKAQATIPHWETLRQIINGKLEDIDRRLPYLYASRDALMKLRPLYVKQHHINDTPFTKVLMWTIQDELASKILKAMAIRFVRKNYDNIMYIIIEQAKAIEKLENDVKARYKDLPDGFLAHTRFNFAKRDVKELYDFFSQDYFKWS